MAGVEAELPKQTDLIPGYTGKSWIIQAFQYRIFICSILFPVVPYKDEDTLVDDYLNNPAYEETKDKIKNANPVLAAIVFHDVSNTYETKVCK